MAKEEKLERQEPEKPKRQSTGSMKLPMLIGIIAGVVVIQAIIIVVVMNIFLKPSYAPADTQGGKTEQKKVEKDESPKEGESSDDVNMQFIETGRITTNAKSSDKFVVLNLGLEFKAQGEEEPSEKEGGTLSPIMNAKIKGTINGIIGSMAIEDLQAKRDSLSFIIKDRLKPVFKSNKMFLKDVIIQEFIIQ